MITVLAYKPHWRFALATALLFSVKVLGPSLAFANLTPEQQKYVELEKLNDHFVNAKVESDVDPAYQVGTTRPVPIAYVEVPLEDSADSVEKLHVVDSGLGSPALRQHLFVERDGKKFFRFFIHPHSQLLYSKLILKYGIKGHYLGVPSASTRALLSYDPNHPELPALYLKLGLARRQFGLGRVIADWEVRRSVAITKLFSEVSQEEKDLYGVDLIPEFAGAYIDRSFGTPSYIDANQHYTLQHGMLARDAGFTTEQTESYTTYPLFALFSVQPGGKAPLIIQWAQQSGLTFEEFVDKALLVAFVRATAYLVFHHGLIPDAHGQNIVVRVNNKTHYIEKVLYRDHGSFKVDQRIRWMNKLPTHTLRTHNSAYDFKFEWAGDLIATPFTHWFFPYLFTNHRGQDESLKPFIENYNAAPILVRLCTRLRSAILAHVPGGDEAFLGDKNFYPEKYLHSALMTNAPKMEIIPSPFPNDAAALEAIEAQANTGQLVPANPLHLENYNQIIRSIEERGFAPTQEGLFFSNGTGLQLAFWPTASKEPPLNYDLYVTTEQIYSGYAEIKPYEPPGTKKGVPLKPNPHRPIEAIRFGNGFEAKYQLLGDHSAARFLANEQGPQGHLLLRITADLSGLPQAQQQKLLAKMGKFKSEENPKGEYRKIPLLTGDACKKPLTH